MGSKTGISWTNTINADGTTTKGSTWNATRGCSRVDQGCTHCYAETVAHRFNGPGQPYEGLTVVNESTGEPRWNGNVTLVEKRLLDPLRWQKPRKIFVNSMSDFFHPAIPDEWRDKQMAVMALCSGIKRGHIFQLLTKREEEMLEYLSSPTIQDRIKDSMLGLATQHPIAMSAYKDALLQKWEWPLRNLWLLVSVNDQASADKRIPVLLQTPAAIRGVSAEPLTGPLDLKPRPVRDMCLYEHPHAGPCKRTGGLDWVIIGGESGRNARPFDIQWARDIIAQCKKAGVAVYMKQIGSIPMMEEAAWRSNGFVKNQTAMLAAHNRDRVPADMVPLAFTGKADNPAEWPEDLRVQEFPNGP